jgi:acyl-CoA synthetase (NDP forming)
MDLSPLAALAVERTGLHFSAGIEHGVRALGHFAWWSEFINTTPPQALLEPPPPIPLNQPLAGNWSEIRGRALLQQAGIPLVPGRLATSEDEAVQAARQFGLPVVLKIQSSALPHKSDVGGVALNLNSEQAVRENFTAMLTHVQAIQPDAEIEGILVSPMRSAGLELLVGVIRDDIWGPVLTLGLGGVWTEVLKDTVVRILPVQRIEIQTMLNELRGSALLHAARGQASIDLQALCSIIFRISTFALTLGPQLNALEINPLLVKGAHIEALDVLINFTTTA